MVVFAMLAVMVVFAILAVFAFLATLRIVAVMAVFGGNPRKQRDFFLARASRAPIFFLKSKEEKFFLRGRRLRKNDGKQSPFWPPLPPPPFFFSNFLFPSPLFSCLSPLPAVEALALSVSLALAYH